MNYKLTSFFNKVTAGLYNFKGSEVDLIKEIESEIQNEIDASLLKRPQATKNWLQSVYNEIMIGQNRLQADYITETIDILTTKGNQLSEEEQERIIKNHEEALEVLHALDNIQGHILDAILRIEPAKFLENENFRKAVKSHLPKKLWFHLEKQTTKDQAASQPPKSQPEKLIQISDSAIPLLFDCLKEHFSPEEHPKLEALLKGQKIEGRVHFLKNQNQLAEVFFRLKEKQLLSNTIEEASVWLGSFFTFKHKGQFKNCNQTSVSDVFSKPEKRPKEHKAICTKIDQ